MATKTFRFGVRKTKPGQGRNDYFQGFLRVPGGVEETSIWSFNPDLASGWVEGKLRSRGMIWYKPHNKKTFTVSLSQAEFNTLVRGNPSLAVHIARGECKPVKRSNPSRVKHTEGYKLRKRADGWVIDKPESARIGVSAVAGRMTGKTIGPFNTKAAAENFLASITPSPYIARKNPSKPSTGIALKADLHGYYVAKEYTGHASGKPQFVVRSRREGDKFMDSSPTLAGAKSIRTSLWRYHQMKGEGPLSNPSRRRKDSKLARRHHTTEAPYIYRIGGDYGLEKHGRKGQFSTELIDYSDEGRNETGIALLNRRGNVVDYDTTGGRESGDGYDIFSRRAVKLDAAKSKRTARSRGRTHSKARKSTRSNTGYYAGLK